MALGLVIRMILFLELLPEIIVTAFCGTLKVLDKNLISSRLAAPSTGDAAIRTRSAPSWQPASSLREARGTTRTLRVIPFSSSRCWPTRQLILIGKSEMVNRRQATRARATPFLEKQDRPGSQQCGRDRRLTDPNDKKCDQRGNIEHSHSGNHATQWSKQRFR